MLHAFPQKLPRSQVPAPPPRPALGLFWSRASPRPMGSSHPCLSSPFSRLCQGLPGLHGGRAWPL